MATNSGHSETAERLITESAESGETRYHPWSYGLESELLAASDDTADHAETDEEHAVTEYWGEDEDGRTWRVHLVRDVQSS